MNMGRGLLRKGVSEGWRVIEGLGMWRVGVTSII